jgi:hypothetical protein
MRFIFPSSQLTVTFFVPTQLHAPSQRSLSQRNCTHHHNVLCPNSTARTITTFLMALFPISYYIRVHLLVWPILSWCNVQNLTALYASSEHQCVRHYRVRMRLVWQPATTSSTGTARNQTLQTILLQTRRQVQREKEREREADRESNCKWS